MATEKKESVASETYANIVATRRDNADSPEIKALIEALQTDHIKDYIESTYEGAVVPIF